MSTRLVQPASPTPRSREVKFLLWLLADDAKSPAPEEVTSLDWPTICRTAGQSLLPFINHRIGQRGLAREIPSATQEVLRGSSMAAAMQYLDRKRVLRAAIGALDRTGIPSIVLKGMALAHTVYPTPTLRPMGDLDIWVAAGRFDDAIEVLQQARFEIPREHRGRLGATFDQGRFGILGLPDSNTTLDVLELPESLFGLPPQELKAMWDNARTLKIDDITFQILAPEDQIEHLCLHMSRKHQFWTGIRPVLDLQLLVNHSTQALDWAKVQRQDGGPGLSPWIYVCLAVARNILGARVPEEVFESSPEHEELDTLVPRAIQLTLESANPPALPRFLKAAATEQSSSMVTILANRLRRHYITREEISKLGARAAMRAALDRVRADLFVKLPRYVRSFRRRNVLEREGHGMLAAAQAGNEIHEKLSAIDANRGPVA